jgi:hypothetical protein
LFFCFATAILGITICTIYCWKGLENMLPTVYYMPIILKNAVAKQKKQKNCNHLATTYQAGQKKKNCN